MVVYKLLLEPILNGHHNITRYIMQDVDILGRVYTSFYKVVASPQEYQIGDTFSRISRHQ